MAVIKYNNTLPVKVREGLERKLISGENLMTVIIDFSDGPWKQPEPPHNHVHEQTSYVAEGEIIFFCEGEPDQHLKAGDMFFVPSGRMHTVQLLTEKVRLVDSFTPLREDFISS